MLVRLFTLFILIFLAAAIANWLMVQPGRLSLEWLGWRMEMRSSLAVTLVIIFALFMVFFDRLQRALRSVPGWFGGRWRQRRDIAGQRALTLGLMAVSAGEPDEACKQAARAHRMLDAPQLTGLLSAQAAHLAGDHAAAQRYFTALTKDQESAFLGHIGLMRLAQESKNKTAALESGNKALELKPQSALAAAQLLQLYADQANWSTALEVFAIVIKDRKKFTRSLSEPLRRQRTALLYLDGVNKLQTAEDTDGARRRFEAALHDDPTFLPAIFALADVYAVGSGIRKITKHLENSFMKVPHADIANRLFKIWGDNDGNSIANLIKLIPEKPASAQNQAHEILGDIAASKGLDGEARRLRALHDAGIAAFGWQCVDCKSRNDDWHSHCPSCGKFAGLKWQQPDRVTPLIGA